MSATGRATAFAAEAALWVVGAAIVAGMAGAHWDVDLPIDMSSLTGETPAPAASPSPSATPTLVIQTLAPGASPTASPLAIKYQAYVARADYQFRAKYTNHMTGTINGQPYDVLWTGELGYKGGDTYDFGRRTSDGRVTTVNDISMDTSTYESVNGAAWTKAARPSTDSDASRLVGAPVAVFIDRGVETKNGLQLHRLEIADPVAYSKALKAVSQTTDAQATYTVWVNDQGVPSAIKLDGWSMQTINKVATKIAFTEELRIVATSGVSITAPI